MSALNALMSMPEDSRLVSITDHEQVYLLIHLDAVTARIRPLTGGSDQYVSRDLLVVSNAQTHLAAHSFTSYEDQEHDFANPAPGGPQWRESEFDVVGLDDTPQERQIDEQIAVTAPISDPIVYAHLPAVLDRAAYSSRPMYANQAVDAGPGTAELPYMDAAV